MFNFRQVLPVLPMKYPVGDNKNVINTQTLKVKGKVYDKYINFEVINA